MSDKFIKNILDVPGVEGVCLFDQDGRVLSNQLPAFFVEDLFDDLARRVVSLYETVDENFVPCDDYLLKYSERWLFLRRGNGTFLLVLASSAVNRVSLKMVTNLALKNIKPKDFSPGSAAPAPALVTDAPAPPPAATESVPKPVAEPAVFADPSAPTAEKAASVTESPTGRKRVARPRPSRTYRGSDY